MFEKIMLIAVCSLWFADTSGIPQYIKKVLFNFGIKNNIEPDYSIHVRLYPIDCEKCLSFWIALIVFWSSSLFIPLACVTSFLTVVLSILYNKIK